MKLKRSIYNFLKIIRLTFIIIFLNILLLTILRYSQIKELVLLTNTPKYTNTFVYPNINIYLPEDLTQPKILSDLLKISYQNKSKYTLTNNIQSANLKIDIQSNHDRQQKSINNNQNNTQFANQMLTIETQIFVPVGHFYWIQDYFSPDSKKQVYCIQNTCNILKKTYPEYTYKQVNDISKLKVLLKKNETIPAIININQLDPEFKLLVKENSYYLDTFDDKASFPVYYVIQNVNPSDKKYLLELGSIIQHNPNIKQNNEQLQQNKVFSFIQTGVTAIARALAQKMEAVHDMTYPAKDIKDFLKNADLTHTSNEVSFVKGCVPQASMRFCANPQYYELLKYIDLDIVELTGNHNNDYGANWNAWTIKNFYQKNQIDYFGGGLNDKDASKILYKTVKNTKIALLGYNYYDTIYNNTNALATSSHAGANSFSFAKLKKDIATAKKNADIVIVDFQFQECYCYPDHDVIYPICYKPLANPDQRGVFKKAIDYGADIVVGTQAHQPQTYEIYKGKPIFYGLGNLFFDQIYWIGTRQGLILKHYFYNGKYIQTRIITTLQSKDQKQHIVWDKDRKLLLQLLKQAR